MRVGACTAGRVYLFRLVAVIHDSERGHPVAGLGWTTPGRASVQYNHDPGINDYFIPRFDGVPHGGTLGRKTRALSKLVQNGLLWLQHEFEFREVTAGCFEKLARGWHGTGDRFVFRGTPREGY
jgi:hypothetical protein